MEYKVNKDNIWLGLRFVALPAILIPPFWLIKYTTEKCFTAMLPNGSRIHPGEKSLATVGQATSNPKYFGMLLSVLLIGFLLVSFLQVGSKKYRLRYVRAKQQLLVAVVSVMVTVPIYAFMHRWSQYQFPPNWSCGPDGMLHGSLNAHARFGLGLAPVAVVVMVVIYLLAPLMALLVTRPKSQKLWLNLPRR